MARVTLQTIADQVGVSRMTVSNAFSRPDQLSEALRERILAAAEHLGYAGPDPAARALSRGRTGVIGVLLTNSAKDAFADDVAVGFVRGAAGALADAGYSMALLHSGDSGGAVPARDIAMDGAIIYSCTPKDAGVAELRRRGLPLVMVEGKPIEGVASVGIDDESGAAEAARHLVELGHRDVALIAAAVDADDVVVDAAPPNEHPTMVARMRGWCETLAAAGIRPRVVGTSATAVDDVLRARIGSMLDHPPTAVLAWSDLAAIEVLEAARARGIAVPEELSIVGFDDNPVSARVSPPLTTVRQDVDLKGVAAAEALLSQLRGGEPEVVAPLHTELVVRGSTAPPRARAGASAG